MGRRGFSGPDGATTIETAQSCLDWLSAKLAPPKGAPRESD